MPACSYCKTELSNNAFYCPSCAEQVRCKHCQAVVLPNARACINCGKLLGDGATNDRVVHDTDVNGNPRPINSFRLKENRSSREITLEFTDFAIDRASNAIGQIMGSDPFGHIALRRRHATNQQLLPGMTDDTSVSSEDYIEVDVQTERQVNTDKTMDSGNEHLRQIFFKEGARYVLDDLSLKANSQLDASRRLTYLLLLFGHEIENVPHLARDVVNETLRDVGLYDPNVSNWISTSAHLREDSSGERSMIRLRKRGREEAREILKQMLDPSVQEAWVLSDRARSRSGKSSLSESGATEKSGSNTSGTRGRKRNPAIDMWVKAWQELGLSVDGHSIAKDAKIPLADRGIFGLWAIRKATSNAVKIVSGGDLVTFMYRAFVVQLDRRNMTRALEQQGKGRVLKVPKGYEINPTGINDAERIAGLTSKKSVAKK